MAECPTSDSAVEQALKKLADQLTCGICLESYTDPKLLQCFHVFCKNCLEQIAARGKQGQPLDCPNCRRPTQLPSNGISGLQAAFHIHHFFEIQSALKKLKSPKCMWCEKCDLRNATSFCRNCGQFICETCAEMHETWKELASHEVISLSQLEGDVTKLVPPKKTTMYCPQHPTKELDLYCETCDELICRDCIVRVHRDHQYDLTTDAFPKHRDTIVSQLQPVKEQLSTVNQAIEGLDVRCQQITDQRTTIEANIHETIRQLQEALEGRKTELISQLDRITQQKLESLAAQRDQFELVQTQLSSCLDFVSENLRTGSEGEILAMKKPVVKQIKEVTTYFKPDTLVPEEHADIRFSCVTELSAACQQFGKVYVSTVSPEKCHATGKGLEVATIREEATITLHVIDQQGQEYEKLIESISCELVSCKDGTTVKPDVKRRDRNKYEISYKPATRGRHQLHIRVEGEHVKGSPFTVVALRKLGTPIRTIGGLTEPKGVAVNKKGQIIVTENGRHCVSIFSPDGEHIKTFGKHGKVQGQFAYPRGTVVDKDDNILIADRGNRRIQTFTADGQFLTSVGRRGSGPLQFRDPLGIGISQENKIYVCDTMNYRIQILNGDMTYFSSFGSEGNGDGQFQYPRHVALDSTGNVYIADSTNHRIQVFTKDGEFLRKFGKKGNNDGILNWPASISIDSDDVVYVAERYNHCVSIFTCDGQFLTSLGTYGIELGQFDNPYGIAVDKNGLIYVCDFGNNRLQVV